MSADLGVDHVLGQSTAEYVGDLLGRASPEFFNGFLRQEPGVRCGDDAGVGEERFAEIGGFGVKDIQRQATQLVLFECLPGGVVIDQSSTRGIDQHGVIGHPSQSERIEQVLGVRGERAVERDDVA